VKTRGSQAKTPSSQIRAGATQDKAVHLKLKLSPVLPSTFRILLLRFLVSML
ncbi:hypothetical protein HAX54_030557, partial [Datura stramonium]|nr:hypothetical protein [Datura stramonium]